MGFVKGAFTLPFKLLAMFLSMFFGGRQPPAAVQEIAAQAEAAVADNVQAQVALEEVNGEQERLARLVYSWCRDVTRDRPLRDISELGRLAEALRNVPLDQIRQVSDGGKRAALALLNDLPGMLGRQAEPPAPRRARTHEMDFSRHLDEGTYQPQMMAA